MSVAAVRYDLYLSYSGRRTYLICPRQYEYRYVRKLPVVRDPRDSLFGSVIGRVFENFWQKSLWATPDPVRSTMDEIDPAIDHVFKSENFSGDPDFVRDLKLELGLYVPSGIHTIRVHKLIAPVSRAELDLTVDYRPPGEAVTIRIGGRADIALQFGSETTWILDGKASKHREKYVDSEQVVWYGVQHYIKYHVAPTRLGFIYWKFPKDPVQWIDYGADRMRVSVAKTVQAAKDILEKRFDPTPNPACGLCPFLQKCPEGGRYMAAKKVADSGRVDNSVFDMDLVT